MIRSSPVHHEEFRELATLEQLDRCLEASHARPILLYKHSLTCGTSGIAAEAVAEWLGSAPLSTISAIDVYVVRVQAARDVSHAISTRLNVRHESPQVLLVVNGVVRWHASHFSITADTIRAAIERLPAATTP